MHPQHVSDLIAVAAAALWDSEATSLVARYRIRVGREDRLRGTGRRRPARAHGRPDLAAVLLGAGGAALGWNWADPAVGLVITAAILAVLYQAGREVGPPPHGRG